MQKDSLIGRVVEVLARLGFSGFRGLGFGVVGSNWGSGHRLWSFLDAKEWLLLLAAVVLLVGWDFGRELAICFAPGIFAYASIASFVSRGHRPFANSCPPQARMSFFLFRFSG